MTINYTFPELPNEYESITEASAQALTSTAYKFTDIFLTGIFKVPAIPIEGLNTIDVENFDPFLDYITQHWQDVVKHDWRLVTTLSLGVLMILALPISAISYCCVKCCCSKVGQASKKNDRTLIFSLGSVAGLGLILCWLAFAWTCGAKVEFDNHIRNGLIKSINVGAKDAQLYMDNLAQEVSHLAQSDFDLLSDALSDQIDQIGLEFAELLNTTVDEVHFQEIYGNVIDISNFTGESNTNTENLITHLNETLSKANEIGKDVDEFKNSNFSLFDDGDFCDLIGEIVCTSFIDAKNAISCNYEAFEAIIKPLTETLNQTKLEEDVVNAIDQIPQEIQKALDEILGFQETFDDEYAILFENKIDEIRKYAVEVSETIQNFTQDLQLEEITADFTKEVQEIITDYYDYVSYAGLLTPLILIGIVLAIFTFGLICGCVGKSGASLSKTGGISMFSSTMITLVLGWIIWLLVTVFYLVGGLTHEVGCTTLEDPAHSPYYTETQLPQFLDTMYQELLNTTESFDLEATLTGFKNNDSIYTALQIEHFYDLNEFDDWQELFDINTVLDDVKDEINASVDEIVTAMKAGLDEEQLNELTNSLRPLISELNSALDLLNINALLDPQKVEDVSGLLDNINETLTTNEEVGPDFLKQLEPIRKSVEKLSEGIDTMSTILNETKTQAFYIVSDVSNIIGSDERLKADDGIIKNVTSLLKDAIDFVDTQTRAQIVETFDNQSKVLINTVDGFVQFCKRYTIDDLGRTGPIYNIYRGAIVSVCDSTVNPFNAYWSGMGVVLILLIPIMIISCVLEPIFRRKRSLQYEQPRKDPQNGNRENYPKQHLYRDPNPPVVPMNHKRSNIDVSHPSQHIYEDIRPPTRQSAVTRYRPEDYFPGYAGKGQRNQVDMSEFRRPIEAIHPGYRRSPSSPKGFGPNGRPIYEIPLVYRR